MALSLVRSLQLYLKRWKKENWVQLRNRYFRLAIIWFLNLCKTHQPELKDLGTISSLSQVLNYSEQLQRVALMRTSNITNTAFVTHAWSECREISTRLSKGKCVHKANLKLRKRHQRVSCHEKVLTLNRCSEALKENDFLIPLDCAFSCAFFDYFLIAVCPQTCYGLSDYENIHHGFAFRSVLCNLTFPLYVLSHCYLQACCRGKLCRNVPGLFDSHLDSLNGLGIFMIPPRHIWRPPLKQWHLVFFLLRVLCSDPSASFTISQIFSMIHAVFSTMEMGENEEVEGGRDRGKAGRPTLMVQYFLYCELTKMKWFSAKQFRFKSQSSCLNVKLELIQTSLSNERVHQVSYSNMF